MSTGPGPTSKGTVVQSLCRTEGSSYNILETTLSLRRRRRETVRVVVQGTSTAQRPLCRARRKKSLHNSPVHSLAVREPVGLTRTDCRSTVYRRCRISQTQSIWISPEVTSLEVFVPPDLPSGIVASQEIKNIKLTKDKVLFSFTSKSTA